MIYTTYFANLKNIQITNHDRIFSIANSQPKNMNLQRLEILIPHYQLVFDYKNGDITDLEYIEEYNKQLAFNDNLNFLSVFNTNYNVFLVCWEHPKKFCHRHLVRNFLNHKNIQCEEYDAKKICNH